MPKADSTNGEMIRSQNVHIISVYIMYMQGADSANVWITKCTY